MLKSLHSWKLISYGLKFTKRYNFILIVFDVGSRPDLTTPIVPDSSKGPQNTDKTAGSANSIHENLPPAPESGTKNAEIKNQADRRKSFNMIKIKSIN